MEFDTGESLRDRFRFHLEHGFYSVPPGRAVCALESARLEAASVDRRDIRFVWEPDEDVDCSWDESGVVQRKLESGEWTAKWCRLEKRCDRWGSWETVDSLSGIIGPPEDPYRRVVEANMLAGL